MDQQYLSGWGAMNIGLDYTMNDYYLSTLDGVLEGVFDVRCNGYRTTSTASADERRGAASTIVWNRNQQGFRMSSGAQILIIFADGGSERYTIMDPRLGEVKPVADTFIQKSGVVKSLPPGNCTKTT